MLSLIPQAGEGEWAAGQVQTMIIPVPKAFGFAPVSAIWQLPGAQAHRGALSPCWLQLCWWHCWVLLEAAAASRKSTSAPFTWGVGEYGGASLIKQGWHLQSSAHRTSDLPSPEPCALVCVLGAGLTRDCKVTSKASCRARVQPLAPQIKHAGGGISGEAEGGNSWDVRQWNLWLRQQSLLQCLQDMD